MADLPTESIQRIADARRDAEAELKKALSAVRESDEVALYLPAFGSFASALFDAEAGELLPVCEDADGFRAALEHEVAPRIVEGILPDRSLSRVTAGRTDEVKRLSIEHDIDTDILWEVGPDGTRKPARGEILGVYAQHGDWENFMPKDIRFLVRWPSNNATVRAALCQTLQQRLYYWAGRFQIRSTEPQAQSESSGPRSVREPFVTSILVTKGWSILDWATDAGVDFHTANDYLKGTTKPYPSTRKKLADSLGVDVGDLPA